MKIVVLLLRQCAFRLLEPSSGDQKVRVRGVQRRGSPQTETKLLLRRQASDFGERRAPETATRHYTRVRVGRKVGSW